MLQSNPSDARAAGERFVVGLPGFPLVEFVGCPQVDVAVLPINHIAPEIGRLLGDVAHNAQHVL